MLRRRFLENLVKWKEKRNKRPLLVKGARQVGKTFIIRKFGHDQYENFIELNFLKNEEHKRIFDGSLDADSIFSLTFPFPSMFFR